MTGEQFTKDNEGLVLEEYLCPAGYRTAGYGHNIDAKGLKITPEQAEEWFREDYAQARKDAVAFAGGPGVFNALTTARQAALQDMAFQMGLSRLLGFKNLRAAVQRGNWDVAHEEALDSAWATQTPRRAHAVAKMLKTGDWPT